MPKLRLKRTPEEEAARQLRKEQARAGKRKRRSADKDVPRFCHKKRRSKQHITDDEGGGEDGEQYGPQPNTDPDCGPGGAPRDYNSIRTEMEEQMFREKMFDALGDDERLDSLEARLNDYAHVPDRWRSGSSRRTRKAAYDDDDAMYGRAEEDFLNRDPRYMDDEEYAEWIRVGMYRKTHAQEIAEQQRKKEARAARKADEKARRAETARLEKLAEEEQKRKKTIEGQRLRICSRKEYDRKWKALLEPADNAVDPPKLTLWDIPWPTFSAYGQGTEAEQAAALIEGLTADAISSFLLDSLGNDLHPEEDRMGRKEKLREAFLRYHPDKFEGRFLGRVKTEDQALVQEAIGQVVRGLNILMNYKG